jgi:hypothetical protein
MSSFWPYQQKNGPTNKRERPFAFRQFNDRALGFRRVFVSFSGRGTGSPSRARKAAPQVYGASGRTVTPRAKDGKPLAVSRVL